VVPAAVGLVASAEWGEVLPEGFKPLGVDGVLDGAFDGAFDGDLDGDLEGADLVFFTEFLESVCPRAGGRVVWAA
jgi:hypothetical protein